MYVVRISPVRLKAIQGAGLRIVADTHAAEIGFDLFYIKSYIRCTGAVPRTQESVCGRSVALFCVHASWGPEYSSR